MLFTEIADPTKITYQKYTHLIKDKNNPMILQRIAQRLEPEPYDLVPRNTSKNHWHDIMLENNQQLLDSDDSDRDSH